MISANPQHYEQIPVHSVCIAVAGICRISTTAADGNPCTGHDIYTLGGTRLNQPPSSGIYIENGKLKRK